ncbi:unnamed protein product [Linum trigynum]|uniref:DUF4283 domain-containing protein n=1 Tax=Linum trigynum TaxID=586398 RepID=A0AAV2DDD8_9ROSI
MPAVPTPLAGAGGSDSLMTTETVAGQRRPPTESSSPNPKGAREAQQTKKRAKQSEPVMDEEIAYVENYSQQSPSSQGPKQSAWGTGSGATRKLFGDQARQGVWYVAESDYEDIAEAVRQEGLDAGFEGEGDPKCPPVYFTSAEERMFIREWRSALVVKALGRSVSYTLMAKRLNSLWARAGTIQVTSAKKGYFLVCFTSGVDYERAVTGGPWMVGDNYLTVHQWTEDFNPYEHEISSTLVWARLLEIPIQYFHPVAVMKIGTRIGKPIRVDQATSTGARSDYARVCVQVDLTKPLLSQFILRGKTYFIQYERLENICLQCGTYYERGRCSCMQPVVAMETETVPVETVPATTEKAPIYGEWMIARKKSYPRKEAAARSVGNDRSKPTNGDETSGSQGGSRFTVLGEEENEFSSEKTLAKETTNARAVKRVATGEKT